MSQLNDWTIPVAPIGGQFLKDHKCPEGKVMGKVKEILIDKWIDSRFQLGPEALGKLMPEILESLKDFIAQNASPQQRSTKRKHVTAVKN